MAFAFLSTLKHMSVHTQTHTHLDSPCIMADDRVVGGVEMTMMMVKWSKKKKQ